MVLAWFGAVKSSAAVQTWSINPAAIAGALLGTQRAGSCDVAPKGFDLHINLNLGKAGAVIYAADLTGEYLDFNKGDVGDPGSLGG